MSYQFTEQSKKARSAILQKLKKEVSGADYEKLPTETPFVYAEKTKSALLANFVQLLTNNHAEVITVTESEITSRVAEVLAKRNIDRLLYGQNGPYAALLETAFNQNVAENVTAELAITLEPYDFNLTDNKDRMFTQTPASITSSRWAIAETGTIVLWPTPQEPRTMSLVPPLHIVVVDANSMHSNFASLVQQQNWKDNMPTNALLISGPSKTADIQQTLAYGAHGPKELIVLLIE